MFCTRCGAQNPDDTAFCRNCSNPLTRPGSQQTDQPASGSYTNPYTIPSQTQQSPQQASQQPGQPPYPGYQGPPVYQSSFINQPLAQQGSASGRAIASMVLSILGLVMCMFFTSIPGMILGKMEMNEINAGRAPKAGETLAKIGFYLGIAGTVIYCLGGAVVALLWSIGMAFSTVQ